MATIERAPSLRVTGIDPVADSRWDAYVDAHPDAKAYHLGAWMTILHGPYRYRSASLALEEDGRLRGVLPLMARRGRVSGARLRSLPAVHTAGPLADTPQLAATLVAAAFDLGAERGLDVNVDTRLAGLDAVDSRLRVAHRLPSYVLEIPDDLDGWLRGRSQNLRRSIRRAEKAGVIVREAADEQTLAAWYQLYLGTMRRHRSVPRPLRQLELARRELPRGVFRLFVAEREGQLLGGGIFHAFNGSLELLYNASDEDAWTHRPNHALYHETIRWTAAQGMARFDFGFANPGDSLAEFKEAWGAEPVAEYRYVDARHGAPPPDAGGRLTGVADEDQAQGLRLLVHRAWGRAPLRATATAGGLAYRYL